MLIIFMIGKLGNMEFKLNLKVIDIIEELIYLKLQKNKNGTIKKL